MVQFHQAALIDKGEHLSIEREIPVEKRETYSRMAAAPKPSTPPIQGTYTPPVYDVVKRPELFIVVYFVNRTVGWGVDGPYDTKAEADEVMGKLGIFEGKEIVKIPSKG